MHSAYITQLLNEVHLERATYTAVLKGNKTVILFPDNASLLNEVSIDVHFTYIIDYHREAYALTISQNPV